MKLNHINLPVADVAASRDFFAKHFGMAVVMENERAGLAMLRDEGEMVLILSHFDRKAAEVAYHRDFHVGFYVDGREAVDAAHAGFLADGLAATPPRKLQGRYTSYVKAPGGFEVEVAALELDQERPTRGEP